MDPFTDAQCLRLLHHPRNRRPVSDHEEVHGFPAWLCHTRDDEIQSKRIRVLAFESSEGRAVLTADEAFVGAFDSFHARMLDSLVRADGPDEDLARWARDRAAAELGWECAQSLEVVEVLTDGSGPDTTLNRFEFGDCSSG